MLAPGLATPDQISRRDRDLAENMLQQIAADIKKHYYDPQFHGVDWEASVKQAKQKIGQSDSLNRALSEVAAVLDALHDSHTFFLPPRRPFRHDYGWEMQMIGGRCYVIRVRPGSDAESKGLKPGDEILAVNGFGPTRDTLWKMEYIFNTLRPQPGLHVVLADPAGQRREVDVMAKMTQLKKVMDLTGGGGGSDIWELVREGERDDNLIRARYAEVSDDLMILKMPEFAFSETEVDAMMSKARKRQALIIDLRGNPGGAVESLKCLVAGTFEGDVKIGDRVGREARKPMVAKKRRNPFTGKLVVLVDSKSASAAEIYARVVQIERRGTVLGDSSSGSVMEAKDYSYQSGSDTVVFFGASITDADLIMGDGKSLEHAGVVPDRVLLPTATDLANGLDPVLASAAAELGVKITPEAAGKIFPFKWPER